MLTQHYVFINFFSWFSAQVWVGNLRNEITEVELARQLHILDITNYQIRIKNREGGHLTCYT